MTEYQKGRASEEDAMGTAKRGALMSAAAGAFAGRTAIRAEDQNEASRKH